MRYVRIILVVVGLVVNTYAKNGYAQWATTSNDEGGTQAVLQISLIGAKVPSKAVLVVDFDPRLLCKPGVGLVIFKGNVLGSFQRKEKAKSTKLSINIDGVVWTYLPYLVQYSNGFEATMPASQNLISSLMFGTTAQANIGRITIEFPISGASSAISAAFSACQSRLSGK